MDAASGAPTPRSRPGSVQPVRPYLLVMAVAVAATAAAVPPLRALSLRTGAVAHPGDRTVHATPTPILGGGALFFGLLVACWWSPGGWTSLGGADVAPGNAVGVIAAAFVIWLTGLIDDIRDVSAPAKVAGMALAGSILTLVGLTIIYFRVPFLGITAAAGHVR